MRIPHYWEPCIKVYVRKHPVLTPCRSRLEGGSPFRREWETYASYVIQSLSEVAPYPYFLATVCACLNSYTCKLAFFGIGMQN